MAKKNRGLMIRSCFATFNIEDDHQRPPNANPSEETMIWADVPHPFGKGSKRVNGMGHSGVFSITSHMVSTVQSRDDMTFLHFLIVFG